MQIQGACGERAENRRTPAKALLQTPGVISAKVSQQSKTATAVAKDDANETAMLEAIAKTGYEGAIVK